MMLERVFSAASDLETPVAVIDEETMERNLSRMADLAAEASVRLRPHAKTHKSPYVGLRQVAHGAVGLTVATLREAEVFLDAGVQDLLLAYPPVGEAKLRRLTALAGRGRLAVSLDDVSVAAALPDGFDVLWEVDTGFHRVGTSPGMDTVSAVRNLIQVIGRDRFRGLLTFAGHAYRAANEAERRQAAEDEWGGLVRTAELLRREGITTRELSVGSTPTAGFARELHGATEIRPGTYVYGDAQQVALGSQSLDDCALGVVATVVSTPAADRAIIDAGSKALSADVLVRQLESYGLIPNRPDLRLERLSEEHGVITAKGPVGLRVGDRIVVIPAHACTTINLQSAVLMVGPDGARWDEVAARGWLPTSGVVPPESSSRLLDQDSLLMERSKAVKD